MARNPMLEMLSGSSRPVMPVPPSQNNPLAMMSQLKQMVNIMRGQDPAMVAQLMAQRNPQFAAFLQQNKGKTVEQIAADYGIDLKLVQELLK